MGDASLQPKLRKWPESGNKTAPASESLYMKAISSRRMAFFRLGVAVFVALSSGACGGAEKAPEVPVQRAPGGSEAFHKGRQALLRGDYTRAEQYLKLALEDGYAPRQTVLLLVQTCLAGSRFRAALNYAEPHLQNHPEDKALRYLVATVHLGLGHKREGLRQLNLLAARAPGYPDTYFLRGAARWDEGDPAAEVDFERYLSLAPEGRHAAEVRSHLSDIRLAQNEPQQLQWAEVSRDPAPSSETSEEAQP